MEGGEGGGEVKDGDGVRKVGEGGDGEEGGVRTVRGEVRMGGLDDDDGPIQNTVGPNRWDRGWGRWEAYTQALADLVESCFPVSGTFTVNVGLGREGGGEGVGYYWEMI